MGYIEWKIVSDKRGYVFTTALSLVEAIDKAYQLRADMVINSTLRQDENIIAVPINWYWSDQATIRDTGTRYQLSHFRWVSEFGEITIDYLPAIQEILKRYNTTVH
jgi:hypothetical protein